MGSKCITIVAVFVGWTTWVASSSHAETLPATTSGPDPMAASTEASPSEAPVSREETIGKLRNVAYGKNSSGEFREPSARVREAAKQALVLMGDDGKPLSSGPLKPASASPPAGPPSKENPVANQQVDYRTESDSKTDGDIQTPGQSSSDSNWQTQLIAMQSGGGQPPSPLSVQPPSPLSVQPPSPQVLAAENTTENAGNLSFDPSRGLSEIVNIGGGDGGTTVSSGEASAGGQTTLGGMLKDSDTVQDVETQERSGVSMDPHIRSYKWGQIYADVDGAYWSPARLDMDTMLSKIDPGMVSSVNMLSGPYGVRYGPGLAFFDVQRTPTPRFDCSPEVHLNTMFNVESNGGRVSDRETVSGGGVDWGFRGSFGDKEGSAYRSGDGTLIPNAYHSTDEWGEFGYDINPHQRLSFLYQREDQTGVQNPAQFFNTNYLGSYGFQLGIVDDDPTAPWTKLSGSVWYNRTRFNGDNSNESMENFPVMQYVNQSVAYQFGNPYGANIVTAQTEGYADNAGARTGVVLGDKDSTQLRAGGDFRYQGQFIGEQYQISGPEGYDFNTNMPHARMVDPGAYFEVTQPVNEVWTFTAGARVDYVHTEANPSDVQPISLLLGGAPCTASNLSENNILYAFYAMNNVKLDSHWTLDAGFAQGQRPPTLIERYSDGLFISTLQTGFTHTIGDPGLQPERDWQFDVGLSSNYDILHTRARFFQSWIQDYVTYTEIGQVGNPPALSLPEARLVQFINTPLATLTGFELAGDYDWDENLTPFGKMSYVYGWDQSINTPLTGISPLEGTVGIRIHDSNHGKVWGIEPSARLVADQNHLGAIRVLGEPGVIDTVELPTASFVVCNIRGYYNYSKNLSFTAGVNNLFNENYLEHLDLRLQGPSGLPAGTLPDYSHTITRVLEPGISPYMSINWTF
ncbi:MAG: TonB-dependent receptor domain-containing protein [Thermoguttaceae bacterium]